MAQPKKLKPFAKMIHYVLGRHPEEFGLMLDKEGFVKEKELLKAFAEEDGWRHVREGLINELILSYSPCPVERHGGKIRAVDRSELISDAGNEQLPKILHCGVRPAHYPNVLKYGLSPSDNTEFLSLCVDKNLALRMAKRKHHTPVMFTVNTEQAIKSGADLFVQSDGIISARYINPDCIAGPPVPPPDTEAKPKAKAKKSQAPVIDLTPGSFLAGTDTTDPVPKSLKRKKEKGSWKGGKKRMRREKGQMWPDED